MRISDWSSDVCSSDLTLRHVAKRLALDIGAQNQEGCVSARVIYVESGTDEDGLERANRLGELTFAALQTLPDHLSTPHKAFDHGLRSEEHTSELQSLMRISYAVFCLKKKKKTQKSTKSEK